LARNTAQRAPDPAGFDYHAATLYHRQMMTRRFLQLAIVLGLITAVGPFAIDMYLPALPSIGGSLNATPAAVQMSLMVFFITLGVCQLVYGPLSDIFGRKMPLYAGLAIFTIG